MTSCARHLYYMLCKTSGLVFILTQHQTKQNHLCTILGLDLVPNDFRKYSVTNIILTVLSDYKPF